MKLLNRGTLFLSLAAGIVLIVISLIFTANFFYSLASGFIAYCFSIFGVINDFGKVIFLPASIYCFSSKKKMHGLFFVVLWLVCFSISLVASQAFDLNKKNETKNKTLVESSNYQRQTELFNTAKESISNLKNDIATLKKNRVADENKIRADYAPLIANARKLNMLTINKDSVAEITKRMNAEIKQLDVVITTKESSLVQKENELAGINNQFANVGNKVEHTEGLLSFSHWLSSLFGGDPDKLIGNFYLVKNIFSEFLALGLLLLGGMELERKSHTLRPTSPDDKPKKRHDENVSESPSENLTDIKKPKLRTLTVVQTKNKEFDEQVSAYIKVMEQTQKYDVSAGYQKISKLAGLTDNQGKEVYGYLKKIGMLTVENGQTKINRKRLNLA